MFNLFDHTQGLPFTAEKPRAADAHEIEAYLRWLAAQRGIAVPDDARCYSAGIWSGTGEDSRCVLEMPGHGVTDRGIMETLDEAGEVIRSVPLALDKAGKLVLTAAQIAKACALPKVRKTRKAAGKPVERIAAAAAPLEGSAPDSALVARVAALEAAFARMGLAVPDAAPIACNDNAAPPRRTERERAAILRAWRMRREMRARADLDRRALEAANGAYRGAIDALGVRNEQAGNARAAATTYKAEMEAAVKRMTEMERAEAFLIERGDDLRDARDAALARAADMERIALSYEADADALRAELADVRERAANDLRGALAEAEALARRRERARTAAIAAVSFPVPPPPGAVKLPRVLVGAGR